ncbi:MAG: Tol-Pal system protein TolB, partial [Pseudomonadota bacterium]
MRRLAASFISTLLLVVASLVSASDLTIEITKGMDNPTAIAVVPFAWQGSGAAPEDVSAVIESDLLRSGQFAPVARTDMLGMPSTQQEVFYRDWRALDTEYLLIGKVSPQPLNGLRLDYELFDVLRQTRVFSGFESGPASDARMLAHRVADKIYEHLTGIRGAFATRLLYVSVTRGQDGAKDTYRLTMSDSDGARPIVLLESREPLMTPTWAPDAVQIAYVSFETGRPAIFRQDIA